MSQLCNWEEIEFFKKEEFNCSHTGKNEMNHVFMQKLDCLRRLIKRPLVVSSGFRDVTHPIESAKTKAGMHTKGIAVDLLSSHQHAMSIVKHAMDLGIKGIGVKQKGDYGSRFIHLDARETPAFWSY